MLSATQQRVASRIEKLLREKRLNENQLLHLLYIFSREEKVKITRSQNCRLLRIERYSEDTINRVTQFLDVVESLDSSDLIKKQPSGGAVEPTSMSKRKSKTPQAIATVTKKIIRPVQRKKQIERLPSIQHPSTISKHVSTLADESAFTDISALNDWLAQQTKCGKQARKVDPSICCPDGSTTLSLSDRQVPVKKKRKKTAKKRASQKNKEEEEEEEVEEVELVITKAEVPEVDEVIIVGDEDEVNAEEIEGEGDADEIDEEADIEDEEDENDDEPDDEHSAGHSVVESESDDDDDE